MTLKTLHHIAALSFASAALLGVTGCNHEHDDHDGDETQIMISDVPAPVRATFEREAAGGTIKSVEREEKKGKTVYEAEIIADGKTWEIKVDPTGQLLKKKMETEDDEKEEKGKR